MGKAELVCLDLADPSVGFHTYDLVLPGSTGSLIVSTDYRILLGRFHEGAALRMVMLPG